jgi:inner membrane protein
VRARGTGLAVSAGVFVAHLPAGYLLTRRIERHYSRSGLLGLGLAASALPDIDVLRFYLLDRRQVHHHAYWTHVPFWWLLLGLLWFAVVRLRGSRRGLAAGVVIFGNVFLHLGLDTVAGDVRWLVPFSTRAFALFSVPARHTWWVSNFLLHWTFLVEIGITTWAICEMVAARNRVSCNLTLTLPFASREAPKACTMTSCSGGDT